jgi:hypothetical protein
MHRRRTTLFGAAGVALVAAAVALALFFSMAGGSERHMGKFAGGDPDQQQSSGVDTPGEGNIGGYDAYIAAEEAYPASTVAPALAARAQTTFGQLADQAAPNAPESAQSAEWKLYGPRQDATQPGVTAFSGATNDTASRITALVVSPKCGAASNGGCRVWAGASGGGIWTTYDALSPSPSWKQTNPAKLDQTSVGALTLDPTDSSGNTLYLGTGEPNRCSSGCEAGVGIYKSTDGGNHWHKLGDACVDNATYACVNHGDAFLGRAISAVVIDPSNSKHILVGSARAVRGMSHVIGAGGQTSGEPGANEPGLYESWDGGQTFTEVWNGAKPDAGGTASFGVTQVELDPSDPSVVYASAFDAGIWRRDSGAAPTAFNQVFAPQFFQNAGIDRTAFALTTKSGHTRAYVYDGTANGGGTSSALASNFWRTDMADQAASTLLASQGTCTPPPDTTTFPQTYTGWQCLTSKSTGSPYFATDDLCTGQCWYDNVVYTPAGLPDTVYLLGSMEYGEQPCNTNGVGCGNGRSNGRAVIYSTTAGDPDASNNMRTFTDLTMDSTINHPAWCAYAPYFNNGCENAPNGIHPDQHAIAVNPSDPTQIFEGSDGGMIVTSGQFADVSSQCDSQYRNGGGPLPPSSGSYTTCKRMLSRVPTLITHIDHRLSSTLQFVGVVVDPFNPRDILGGTQDNGTWSNLGGNPADFSQVIYGDGGNPAFDATHQGWMANEYTGGYGDVNFENGDPTKWVIATGPMVASGEAVAFYWPQIGDPNPVTYNGQVTHPLYEGAQHVWRSWAFGAGHTGDVPQDTTPDISAAEANCPEFVTSGATPTCGDFMPLGGPAGSNQTGDLTGTAYGSDRTGGAISWIARTSADHGTMWAATSAGRIFVTHNADAVDPSTVTWLRIDNSAAGASPTRYPSSIYIDPSNTDHAWVSYSGYNANTPTTPGHVFSVTSDGFTGGGTFTNLNIEAGTSGFPTPNGDGDLPVSDVVQDDSTHTLYASTDFGVLRGNKDGTKGWHVTLGMPRYEVMHLAIEPSSREATCAVKQCPHVLYAATHSQGVWRMVLGK